MDIDTLSPTQQDSQVDFEALSQLAGEEADTNYHESQETDGGEHQEATQCEN